MIINNSHKDSDAKMIRKLQASKKMLFKQLGGEDHLPLAQRGMIISKEAIFPSSQSMQS